MLVNLVEKSQSDSDGPALDHMLVPTKGRSCPKTPCLTLTGLYSNAPLSVRPSKATPSIIYSSLPPPPSLFPLILLYSSHSTFYLLTYVSDLLSLLSGSSHCDVSSVRQGSWSVLLITIAQCLRQCLVPRGSMNTCSWNERMNALDC